MSALSNYSSLSKQNKRLIWVGYILYTAYIWLLDGFDTIIEKVVPIDNAFLQLLTAILLYWIVAFLILWATDN
jgi:hypothetical protein